MQQALVPVADQQIGRRGRNRLRARLPAKLITVERTRKTILLDLSRSGARVRADPDLACGEQVVLTWSRFEAFGDVVWVEAGMCGIAFDEPLDPEVLFKTREIDACERLPSDSELERRRLHEWVAGPRLI